MNKIFSDAEIAVFRNDTDVLEHTKLESLIGPRGAEWVEKDEYTPRADAMRYEDWEFAYALILGTRQAIEYCLQIGEDKIWEEVK